MNYSLGTLPDKEEGLERGVVVFAEQLGHGRSVAGDAPDQNQFNPQE